MVYSVLFMPIAEKQFKKLPFEIQERIIKVLERIKIRPEAFVEKLVGELGYKLRVGNYRIFLDINQGKLIILVLKVGHRKNVYR